MRTVLKGDAYTYFNQYFMTVGNEDDVTFILSIQALTSHIFPQRALRMQKRYMRRYMRKPRDMKMRVYRNRVVELNNYLKRIPTVFNATQKIDEDEIVDILEFGTPNKWQSEMVHLGFDSAVANSQELVEFCEHLEFDEDLNQKPEAMPKPGLSRGKWGAHMRYQSPSEGGCLKDLKQMISHMEVPTIHQKTVPCMASTVTI